MKPAKGGRHRYKPPDRTKIETLREHAYRLIDFPFLLDRHAEWRRAAISICKAFLAQNPKRPKTPREIAAEVDEVVKFHLAQNVPLALAVRRARTSVAEIFRRPRTAVKKAHMRHGRLGVPD